MTRKVARKMEAWVWDARLDRRKLAIAKLLNCAERSHAAKMALDRCLKRLVIAGKNSREARLWAEAFPEQRSDLK